MYPCAHGRRVASTVGLSSHVAKTSEDGVRNFDRPRLESAPPLRGETVERHTHRRSTLDWARTANRVGILRDLQPVFRCRHHQIRLERHDEEPEVRQVGWQDWRPCQDAEELNDDTEAGALVSAPRCEGTCQSLS